MPSAFPGVRTRGIAGEGPGNACSLRCEEWNHSAALFEEHIMELLVVAGLVLGYALFVAVRTGLHRRLPLALGRISLEAIPDRAARMHGWRRRLLIATPVWRSYGWKKRWPTSAASHAEIVRRFVGVGGAFRTVGLPITGSVFLDAQGSSEVGTPSVLRYVTRFTRAFDRRVGRPGSTPFGPAIRITSRDGRPPPTGGSRAAGGEGPHGVRRLLEQPRDDHPGHPRPMVLHGRRRPPCRGRAHRPARSRGRCHPYFAGTRLQPADRGGSPPSTCRLRRMRVWRVARGRDAAPRRPDRPEIRDRDLA
jgi:hypothetical protein